jgi:hypothetical protein
MNRCEVGTRTGAGAARMSKEAEQSALKSQTTNS